jgi:hypothetical protein
MLGLKDQCIHPTSQKQYIKSFSGGKNNSPEGHSVKAIPTGSPAAADMHRAIRPTVS